MRISVAWSLETSLGVAVSCSPLYLYRKKGLGKEVHADADAMYSRLAIHRASHSAGLGALVIAVTSPYSGPQYLGQVAFFSSSGHWSLFVTHAMLRGHIGPLSQKAEGRENCSLFLKLRQDRERTSGSPKPGRLASTG